MRKVNLALICLFLAIPCSANTITVNWDGSGDFNTIQERINAAVNGDADCKQEYIGHGTFWVGFVDLGILVDNWVDKQGIPAAYQADFSHSADLIGHTPYRVQYVDLYILVDNWVDKLGSPPDCLDCP